MSIFSKKSKPREPDNKTKQQPTNNGIKVEHRRLLTKHAAAPSTNNGVLSAGDRLAQRAQIMAASRRRMNSETPDYSITGAAKSHPLPYSNNGSLSSQNIPREAQLGRSVNGSFVEDANTKYAPQNFSKPPKHNGDVGRSRTHGANDFTPQASRTPTMHTAHTTQSFSSAKKPKDVGIAAPSGNIQSPTQRTLSMPMDSPTLGFPYPLEERFARPQPSSDSGYGSAAQSSVVDSRKPTEVNAVQETNPSGLPGVNTQLMARWKSNREFAQQHASRGSKKEGKPSVFPPATDQADKRDSGSSSTYVSKLDPGPSDTVFAEPIETPRIFSKETGVFEVARSIPRTDPQQEAQHTQSTEVTERGRTISPTPYQPQTVTKPSRSRPKDLSQISTGQQIRPPATDRTPVSPVRKKEVPQARADTSQPATSSAVDSGRDATASPYISPTSQPELTSARRVTTTMGQFMSSPSQVKPQQEVSSLPAVSENKTEAIERPQAAPAARSSFSTKRISTPEKTNSVKNTTSPTQTRSESRASLSSERRSTLPPLSVLEGLKVNRRGLVLDEEGEIVGELFEGDIIDCVRQKISAEGDVVDEFGNPVGRVRTVRRGHASAGRFSVSSISAFGHPSGPYQWARKDSSASQHTQPHRVHSPQASVSHTSPPSVDGNVPVAELDASAETEAAPMVDHSEIFSPFGGSPIKQRAASPATSQRTGPVTEQNRSVQPIAKTNEPTAEERRDSQSVRPESKEETPVVGISRKWTSRYFEPPPGDAQEASRRSSLKGDTTQPSTAEKATNQRSTSILLSSDSKSGSRAVIGPTLESLLGQSTLFSHKAESFSLNGSSSSLPLSPSKPESRASTTPARATSPSLPRTSIARPPSGLGPQASVRSSYSQHQPIRKSPLHNSETTPPGSGVADSDVGKMRNMAFLATVPRTNIATAGKTPMESDEAAFIPDIPKARPQQRKASTAARSSENALDKRKTRFSMWFGK